MWTESHKTALTDLDLSFLNGYKDTSYRNDEMPSFLIHDDGDGYSVGDIKLWVDYAEVEERENEEAARFHIVVHGGIEILSTDDIEEVKTCITKLEELKGFMQRMGLRFTPLELKR